MLFFRLFDQPGVHLSRWFEFISDNHFMTIIPSLIMTALVFIPMLLWLKGTPPGTAEEEEIRDFHVLTVLFIWTILVAYHRLYDTFNSDLLRHSRVQGPGTSRHLGSFQPGTKCVAWRLWWCLFPSF